MISKQLAAMLEEQIGWELKASNHYLATAAYFASNDLDGWAKAFYAQSEEEREHALKIVKFLIDTSTPFNIPAVSAAETRFESALEACQKALTSEQAVTAQFKRMAQVALSEGDYVGFQFLQWFLDEQVEEEALMGKYISLIESGINLFQAEEFLSEE
ncbi:MAG: ferritin [Armatimonadetes bacterium]|nr:ferritin [Armatimonadota bacterium]